MPTKSTTPDRAAETLCSEHPALSRSAVVLRVPVEQLRTSFAALRRGRIQRGGSRLAELPLRVWAREEGTYELLDGFKRLERWCGAGATHVPVVVESLSGPLDAKAALLAANAPRRTLSVLDEARVVASLRNDDGLGPKTIAHQLGRRPCWVRRRLALARGLSSKARLAVDAGRVGPSLAHALTGLRHTDQDAVLASARRHALRAKEAMALVSGLLTTRDAVARERLLTDPLALVRPGPEAPLLGSLAERLSERLARAKAALEDLAQLELPTRGLTDAERRRLESERRRVLFQLTELAQALTGTSGAPLTPAREEIDHDRQDAATQRSDERERSDAAALSRADPATNAEGEGEAPPPERERAGADPAAERGGAGHSPDREADRAQPALDPPRAHTSRQTELERGQIRQGEQARPLPRADQGEGRQGADDHADPPRAARAGLHRGALDPLALRARAARPARAAQEPQGDAALRDRAG